MSEEVTLDAAIAALRAMVESQGVDGNWNYDPYMHGMYNGLVVALSVVSEHSAIEELRAAPDEWLHDKSLHEQHPALYHAWEEYNILRKLIEGDDE